MASLVRDIAAASLLVIVAVFTYKFGLLFGIPIGFVALFVFIFSGIGKRSSTNQTFECTDRKRKPGQTLPRRRHGIKDLKEHAPDVKTLYENFQHGLKISKHRPCLAKIDPSTNRYVAQTYEEVHTRILNLGSGFLHLGLEPKDRVGIYAKNCVEWVIAGESCNAYSLTSVAIYDTLGEEHREFIVNQSKIKAIVTTSNLLNKVCDVAPKCPNLKIVVLIDKVNGELVDTGKKVNLAVYSFEQLENIGKENQKAVIPPKPEDLAILMYTSGTTSRPKGVMMSHGNVAAVLAGVNDVIPNFSYKDRFFSYLPLAHILERAAEAAMIYQGASIGFFRGDLRLLTEDVSLWKPTIYAGVPKVFQRVMNVVKKKVEAKPKAVQKIFWFAFELRAKLMDIGIPTGIFDKTIFKEVRNGLGGHVRFIVSGGAPLGTECHKFVRVCFGAHTIQGYGLTETCGGVSAVPHDLSDPYEKAGVPFTCCEVKLVDAGKYKTSSNPPQGEICVRGPNITLGYYENKEKTDEVFVVEEDGERWFHTGDVGRWNPDGTFSIVGRVKDIFKLDGGEYVAPERLETIYSQSKLLSNIFVYGDSNKSHLVAVCIPECGAAKQWAKENGVKFTDVVEPNVPKEICANEDFKKLVKESLQVVAKAANLNNYEYLPAIHLDGVFWTADTGLVTDAMKNKRDPLFDHYKKEIEKLYEGEE